MKKMTLILVVVSSLLLYPAVSVADEEPWCELIENESSVTEITCATGDHACCSSYSMEIWRACFNDQIDQIPGICMDAEIRYCIDWAWDHCAAGDSSCLYLAYTYCRQSLGSQVYGDCVNITIQNASFYCDEVANNAFYSCFYGANP